MFRTISPLIRALLRSLTPRQLRGGTPPRRITVDGIAQERLRSDAGGYLTSSTGFPIYGRVL